ncbi:hypothetical protein GF314_03530 [bacterium]|nr:hypothetical protein [bacterium]
MDSRHRNGARPLCHRGRHWCSLLATIVSLIAGQATAQIDLDRDDPCCDVDDPRVVWLGDTPSLTFVEIAAHVAPILWFSPDEPLLRDLRTPEQIDIPMAFPFQDDAGGPVVYYRVREVARGAETGPAVTPVPDDRGATAVHLDRVTALDIDFFFYYPSEEGLGGHVHDVEALEIKVVVLRQPRCDECRYGLAVVHANALAHGLSWYDNTLETDEYTVFPLTILVEEGKHASCTDKNGDGYYTPGYDVNKRVNDAWGVRDVMRTGALFTGGFESWLAKVRRPHDRVLPPLPVDSRARPIVEAIERETGLDYPRYELRPYPRLADAHAHDDPGIIRFVDKGHDDWPTVDQELAIEDLAGWASIEDFTESFSVAARFDDDFGVSAVFPLLILRNVNEPLSGGWLVNRIYLKDEGFRDFGYNVIYTSSASRWIDGYFSAGLEVDREPDGMGGETKRTSFTTETGFKLRGNVAHSPVSFLSKLTHFWGVRVGVRYKGYKQFNEIGYVVEVGAGSF